MRLRKSKKSKSRILPLIHQIRVDKWEYCAGYLSVEMEVYRNGEIFCCLFGEDFNAFSSVMKIAKIPLTLKEDI